MSRVHKVAASPTTDQPAIGFPAGFFDMWTRSGDAYLTALSAWVAEAARFSERRLQKDLETFKALRGCSTWSEVATLQKEWTATAVQDYLAQISHAGQLFQHCTASSTEQAAHGQQTALREPAA